MGGGRTLLYRLDARPWKPHHRFRHCVHWPSISGWAFVANSVVELALWMCHGVLCQQWNKGGWWNGWVVVVVDKPNGRPRVALFRFRNR
jgi:hypothetical protein